MIGTLYQTGRSEGPQNTSTWSCSLHFRFLYLYCFCSYPRYDKSLASCCSNSLKFNQITSFSWWLMHSYSRLTNLEPSCQSWHLSSMLLDSEEHLESRTRFEGWNIQSCLQVCKTFCKVEPSRRIGSNCILFGYQLFDISVQTAHDTRMRFRSSRSCRMLNNCTYCICSFTKGVEFDSANMVKMSKDSGLQFLGQMQLGLSVRN